MGGNVNVAIGEAMTGIAAVVTEADPPVVTSVALGNVDGITLAVGGGQGDATATKDGKSYKITGNAYGIDMANPMQPAKKPFELEFTCP
jgi:lipoprotein LpqH